MGVWKVGKNVSLDLDSLRIVKWGKELHSPMFDAERSDSLFFRFVLRQWELFMRAGLAMPEIMQAVVRVNQQLQPAKSCQSILEFPVAHVTGETDGLAICKGDAGPFPMKFSRLGYGRAELAKAWGTSGRGLFCVAARVAGF